MPRCPTLPLLALLLLSAACDLGNIAPAPAPDPGSPSGGGPDGGPAAPDTGGAPDAAPLACAPLSNETEDGEHRPGEPCLTCHAGQDDEAPPFTLGGTIYNDLTGTAAVSGATLEIVDADGQVIELTSARNGNVYTNQPIAFPIRVNAAGCKPMIAPIDEAGADCNSAGCHDADFRIFVP